MQAGNARATIQEATAAYETWLAEYTQLVPTDLAGTPAAARRRAISAFASASALYSISNSALAAIARRR